MVLSAALIHHFTLTKIKGSALKAADDFHYAPVLSNIYSAQAKGRLDPYNIGLKLSLAFAVLSKSFDRAIDRIYNVFVVSAAFFCARKLRRAHTGNYALYLAWSVLGMIAVVVALVIKW
jgi:hypothetical protein